MPAQIFKNTLRPCHLEIRRSNIEIELIRCPHFSIKLHLFSVSLSKWNILKLIIASWMIINLSHSKFKIFSIWMFCPKLPIWDLCQQPRHRVGSPRRLIMLTNAHSQVSQRVVSVTDIHRDSEAGSLSYRMSWNTNASFSPPEWNARECDQSSSDQAPGVPMSQSSVSSVSWSGPGTQLRCSLRNNRASPLQAISMKPMSNRIVLALVVIWNCNVSMKMPPKIDFFIRKDLALKLNYFHHKLI